MKCKSPYRAGVDSHPCGRCAPCRINRGSVWATRLTLESYLHGDSVFITLTYNDESLPADPTRQAQRADVQAFLKKLRKLLPKRIRYFICPEFGSQTNRLHYHGILFGVSPFDVHACETAWGRGFVQLGECNPKTITYCTKYILNGDSRSDNEHEKPTRAFMSRRPGIGYDFVSSGKQQLQKIASLRPDGSLPASYGVIRLGGRTRPIGRYLSAKLSEFSGTTEEQRQQLRAARAAEVVEQRKREGIALSSERDIQERSQHGLNALAKISIRQSKEKL